MVPGELENLNTHFDDFRTQRPPQRPPSGSLCVSRLRVLRVTDHQASYYPQTPTWAQGPAFFRPPLSAIIDTLERIRKVESPVWYGKHIAHSGGLIHSQLAGALVYLSVAGQKMLVLNSHKVAADLLDRRGTIYSDRPQFISKLFVWMPPKRRS